jgi:hypothetical protein
MATSAAGFRLPKTLDAEMKDTTKCGIAQKSKKEETEK